MRGSPRGTVARRLTQPEVVRPAASDLLSVFAGSQHVRKTKPRSISGTQYISLTASSTCQIRVDSKELEAGDSIVHTVRGVLVPATAPIGDAVAPQDECERVVKEGDTLSNIAKVRAGPESWSCWVGQGTSHEGLHTITSVL